MLYKHDLGSTINTNEQHFVSGNTSIDFNLNSVAHIAHRSHSSTCVVIKSVVLQARFEKKMTHAASPLAILGVLIGDSGKGLAGTDCQQ